MSQDLSLKGLLEAGSHFGHQTHKWNPKMKKYIFGEKNGIYIIDLAQTVDLAKKAYDFLRDVSTSGKPVLFVGTKRQASAVVKGAAERCGAYSVTHRWLGGMLTNYKTVFMSIDKLRKVEKMKENGDYFLLTKKEQAKVDKEVEKLERNLGGIKNMRKLPGALFVVDPDVERIAVNEAKTLGIPVVAVVDTNCDPTSIDYVIPGNDDAIKSITLFVNYLADSVAEGTSKVVGARDKEDGTEIKDTFLEQEILAKYERDIDLVAAAVEEPEEKIEE